MAPVSKTKLKGLNSNWKKAAKREPQNFEDLEPGIYLAGMQGELGEFKGKMAIRWKYTVQEGDCAGQEQSDFDNLETEDNLFWIQSKLAKLGYELPEDITELPEVLDDINEAIPIVRIKVAEKNGYTNVYINKLVEEEGGETRKEILGEADTAKPEKEEKAEPKAKSRSRKKKEESVDEGGEFKVGDKVSFVEEGETFTGTITELNEDGENADVEVDDEDETWDVEISDLTKLEAEKPKSKKKTRKKKAKTIEVGSTVTFDDEGEEVSGEVKKIDGKNADVEVDDEEWEVPLADLTLA